MFQNSKGQNAHTFYERVAKVSNFFLQSRMIVGECCQLYKCVIVEMTVQLEMNAFFAIQNVEIIEKLNNFPFGCSPRNALHINQIR